MCDFLIKMMGGESSFPGQSFFSVLDFCFSFVPRAPTPLFRSRFLLLSLVQDLPAHDSGLVFTYELARKLFDVMRLQFRR
jgi:hypothetical protein